MADTFDRRRLLAKVLFALTVAAVAGGVGLTIVTARTTTGRWWQGSVFGYYGLAIAFAAFPVIGLILATKRPDNALSWLTLAIGVTVGVEAFITSYARYALHGGPGGPSVAALLTSLDQASWIPIVALPPTFLLLLFPTGHLPSPRWRWFARLLGASLVLVYVVITLTPGPMADSDLPTVINPLGAPSLKPILDVAFIAFAMLPIGIVAAVVSLVQRFRRADEVTRAQLRWVVLAAGVVGTLYAVALILSVSSPWMTEATPAWLAVLQNVALLSFTLIPISIAIAVLRYHLFDIDLVINRAVVIGVVAIFITLVYVGVVVGIGSLVGARTSPVLSALAAAVVATAFQPVRRRAHRLANRVVYGERATPYEVLSVFAERLGSTYAQDDLLLRIAGALVSGTAAETATVFIRLGEDLVPRATWPEGSDPLPTPPLDERTDARTDSPGTAVLVRHDDEVLGALALRKRPNESLSPTEQRLIEDVAGHAGLVLRNVALTEQLRAQLEELRASRQRLVTAQDEERRKLERNIHDGAQQQLVALAVKARLAEQLRDRDPDKGRQLVEELQQGLGDALEDLRDLARGIYPPLLADRGLAVAIDAQARKAAIPVSIEANGVARYRRETEAAVYFCVLEGLQNVAKYASANHGTVRLGVDDGALVFEVVDDGLGFDTATTSYGTGLQGIADRLAALGGTLDVRSRPGAGTTIVGRVPLE
jgi:signal transduction histidine kinase